MPRQPPSQDTPFKQPPKETIPSSSSHKPRRTQHKDASRKKGRSSSRRRAPGSSYDCNVSYSGIEVSETNRVLRSAPKCDNSSFFQNLNDIQQANERVPPAVEPSITFSASDNLKLLMDLAMGIGEKGALLDIGPASNSNNGPLVEITNQTPLPAQQTVVKTENSDGGISSNDPSKPSTVYGNAGEADLNFFDKKWMQVANAKPAWFDTEETAPSPIFLNLDQHNIPDTSPPTSRPIGNPVRFPSGDWLQELGLAPSSSSFPNHCTEIRPNLQPGSQEGLQMQADQCKSATLYGNTETNASFLEEPNWMQATNAIEPARFDTDKTASSPVYLNLDQHNIPVTSPATSGPITSPVRFPSGGCFKRLGLHCTEICKQLESGSHEGIQMRANQWEWSTKVPPNNLTNSETFCFLSTHHVDNTSVTSRKPFGISGGFIERIPSPEIPRQPSVPWKHIFPEMENSIPPLEVPPQVAGSPQADRESDQDDEWRIHLVDTPQPFTHPADPVPTYRRSQRIPTGSANGLMAQQEPAFLGISPLKPKRARRTRGQMKSRHQEMTANYSHSGRRNQRTPRSPSTRPYPMEYHSGPCWHQNKVPDNGLPADRFYTFQRTEVMQQSRYSEGNYRNDPNFFGGIDWSQPNIFTGIFSNSCHRVQEVRNYDPVWAAPNAFHSAGNDQQFHTPPVESVPQEAETQSFTPWDLDFLSKFL